MHALASPGVLLIAEGAHVVSLRYCSKMCRCSHKQGAYLMCERQPGTLPSARNKVPLTLGHWTSIRELHSWSSHRLSSGQMSTFICFRSVLLGMRGELVFRVEPVRCCPGCSCPLDFVTWILSLPLWRRLKGSRVCVPCHLESILSGLVSPKAASQG